MGNSKARGGGGGGVSHSQSQPGDNTSILMGLSVGIIWPQMFFPLPNFLFVRVEVYPELLHEAGPSSPLLVQVGFDPSRGVGDRGKALPPPSTAGMGRREGGLGLMIKALISERGV